MQVPKEIILLKDETVIGQIEGNAFTDSPNPFAKLAANVEKLLSSLFGIRKITTLVLTNKRLIQMDRTKIFWVINRDVEVVTFGKKQIGSFGYYQARRFLIFRTLYFSFFENFYMARITYKGSLESLNAFIMKITEYVHGQE